MDNEIFKQNNAGQVKDDATKLKDSSFFIQTFSYRFKIFKITVRRGSNYCSNN